MFEASNTPPVDPMALLDEWMRLYGQDVLNLAYSYVRNYHQAEDIAQDVFLRAFAKMDSFRGDSSVKTWLLTITANRCKDYLRSWVVQRVVVDDEHLNQVVDDVSPELEVARKLEEDGLWAAVHSLPAKYSEVLILYYRHDLSSREIAEVLNTTDQNVRTRLHRGRAMLKRLLEGEGSL
ncbi:sigma-70 family RNA polymerase sigma factor [Alicyclobacillus shizuokensis]|uniref:sigma-70 family RNA polymerase sigma factor n=1 Tax=Alicyclobacillus shizuokensis TaxID=392014 RepID=UPI001FE08957|nr:sigma-70 family RNA polymerase sigma factor [Alicyclobacillus shizuokensis]